MSASRFVILAAPRTGSNLLCTLLDSHPGILCHHEVFNPRGIFYALDYRDGSMALATMAERDQAPFEFLQNLWEAAEGAQHVGFKMTRGQHEAIMRQVLREESVRKIILRRENRVRTYVSQLIAERTDQWEIYDEAELIDELPRMRIDAGELQRHAESNASFYDSLETELRSTGQSWLDLRYKELLSRGTHERLLEYLGAEPAALVARSVRQARGDLRSAIENFDELAAALEKTDYHAELHDPQELVHDC